MGICTVISDVDDDLSGLLHLLGGESWILDKSLKTTASFVHQADLIELLRLTGLDASEVIDGLDFSPKPASYEFRIGGSWGYCKMPQLPGGIGGALKVEALPIFYPLFHIPPELGYKNEVLLLVD